MYNNPELDWLWERVIRSGALFTWSEFQHVSSLLSNINFFPNCFTSRFSTELTLKTHGAQSRRWTRHVPHLSASTRSNDRTVVAAHFLDDKSYRRNYTAAKIDLSLTYSEPRRKSTWTPCCVFFFFKQSVVKRCAFFFVFLYDSAFSPFPLLPVEGARVTPNYTHGKRQWTGIELRL